MCMHTVFVNQGRRTRCSILAFHEILKLKFTMALWPHGLSWQCLPHPPFSYLLLHSVQAVSLALTLFWAVAWEVNPYTWHSFSQVKNNVFLCFFWHQHQTTFEAEVLYTVSHFPKTVSWMTCTSPINGCVWKMALKVFESGKEVERHLFLAQHYVH